MGQVEGKRIEPGSHEPRDSDKAEWARVCGALTRPSQWDQSYTGQFLQRLNWREGMPIRTTLEMECEKECGRPMVLRPMRFLSPVYREWTRDKHVRALLTFRLHWWMQQQITEGQDTVEKGGYTPMDYHLLLQLAYDLTLPDEMNLIHEHACRMARLHNWSWRAEALWKQVF